MGKLTSTLSLLANPKNWQAGEKTRQLQKALEKYFGPDSIGIGAKVFLLNSGRSSIYVFLKALGIGRGDEVIIQAYTCNSVPNPVLWTGAKPVYADIDPQTLNVDPDQVAKKISSKTKAIILQHTLGRLGPIEAVVELAKKWGIYVLEDCAHCLGADHKGKKLGTFGDGAIISFGREKIISSLAGGALIINNQSLVKLFEQYTLEIPEFPKPQLGKEFLNFFAWRALLRRIYFNPTGQNLIKLLYKFDFFNVVTSQKELVGQRPSWHPSTFPNILAALALEEFEKIAKYNQTRRQIADFYYENIKNKAFKLLPKHSGVYLRVVALHPQASEVVSEAKKRGFWFGNWYDTPIYPKTADEEKLGYIRGACPNAERLSDQTLNLPNFIGMTFEEAGRVIEFINNFH